MRNIVFGILVLVIIMSCSNNVSSDNSIPGQKVYFNRYPTSTVEVWSVNLDGSREVRISESEGNKSGYLSELSPDKSFEIIHSIFGSDPNLYIRKVGSDEKVVLTKGEGVNTNPVFSPDGSMIVFESKFDNNVDLFSLKLYGCQLRKLTNTELFENYPKFSPDGQKIVYTTHGLKSEKDPLGLHEESGSDPSSDYEIFIMDVDGSNQQNLSNIIGSDNFPEFSPNGLLILFQSKRDGNEEIYIMDIDGSNVKRLTNNNVDDIHPHFSPDGTKIVYQTQKDGNREIMIMDTDGGNKKRLTKNKIDDWFPRFEL